MLLIGELHGRPSRCMFFAAPARETSNSFDYHRGQGLFVPGQTETARPGLVRYVNVQPFRKLGRMSLLASALLVIRMRSLSQSSLPSKRNARTPRVIHSVNGAETLKLEHAGSPPLAARIQSR